MDLFVDPAIAISAEARLRRARVISLVWVAVALSISLLTAMSMLGVWPTAAPIGWLVFGFVVLSTWYQPRYGVYAIVFFTLVGDQVLLRWYPFTKNFSSSESLFFLNNRALIFSPLEFMLVWALLAWLVRGAMRRRLDFQSGPLLWPVLVFSAFIMLGLVYGLGTQGNSNIALWETRPMMYLPVMLILTTNLLRQREHVNRVAWLAMIALFILGTYGLYDFIYIKNGEIDRVVANIEHAAAIRFNTLFVLAITSWLYKASMTKRILLPLFAPTCLVTYVVAQRRASFVALGISLVLMGVVLYRENRRVFWIIAPPLAVLAVMYLGAFWNNQSAIGLPARAVKSMVVSDAGNAQENSSNEYRVIENINTSYTIHNTNPLTGVGFGKKFYMIARLADISFFAWYEYIIHNSIMYIWMKAGVGAFLAMLTMVGVAIMAGVRVAWRMPGGDMGAIALMAVLYVLMHFTYAYVDMSWDNSSMIYIGVAMGLINSLERIVALPVPVAPKRYPWQPEPQAPPTLRPLQGGG